MQTIQNDFKNCAVTIWPTSEKEFQKNPVFQFRVKKNITIAVGDFIEVQAQDTMKSKQGIYYKIENILEESSSKAFPNMTIYKCEFSKHTQPLLA
jgi:hypothetical protein